MRKLLAALAVAAAALAFTALPAGAIEQTPSACAHKSGIGYNVYVCAGFQWRVQNDGTGVHFEAVPINIPTGCGDLEATALSSLNVVVSETGNGRVIGNQGGCSVSWDLEANGPDTGPATITLFGNANVNNASDFDFRVTCTVHPNTKNEDCSATP